jgi:cytochrome P450
MAEEAFRWQSPVAHTRRTALADTEIRGRKIRKGEKVILWHVSANNDEEVYTNPREFRIGRECLSIPIGFGHGIHRCVGSRLAEMQLRVLWEEILKRFPEISVTEEPVRMPSTFISVYRAMKVLIPSRL